jgi:pimeloyl-ACP methyl ester carboxylesterase
LWDKIFSQNEMAGKRIKLPVENEFNFLGARLNFQVLGEGRPVILLHGSMIADPWGGFEKQLARYYRVFLPHLPGFGASEAVEGRVHNTELFSEALTEFAKAVGLGKAPVIAFSLGTVVAVRAAAAKGIGGKLVLVGMPIRLESPFLNQIMRLPLPARHMLAANEITRGGLLLTTLKDIVGTADKAFVGRYLQLLRTTDPRAMVDADLVEEVEKDLPWLLQQVKNPMWFVYGEHDRLLRGAEKWLKRRIHVVKGAGHDVFVSQPKEMLRLVRLYLEPGGVWYRIWERLR